jgi:hypothetical protein
MLLGCRLQNLPGTTFIQNLPGTTFMAPRSVEIGRHPGRGRPDGYNWPAIGTGNLLFEKDREKRRLGQFHGVGLTQKPAEPEWGTDRF